MTKKKTHPMLSSGIGILCPLMNFSAAKAPTHIMAERENILTVAQLHLPEGDDQARIRLQLMKLNTSFEVGRTINLV